MIREAYSLHSTFLKYYIIPTCKVISKVPYPNNYVSFWLKSNAKVVLAAMNSAYREGVRYATK